MRINKLAAFLILFFLLLSNTTSSEPGRLLKAFPSHGTSPLGVAWTNSNDRGQLYVMDYSREGYQVYDTKSCKPVGDLVHTGQGPRHGIAIVGDSYYAPYFEPATGDMVIASAKLGAPNPSGVFVLKNASWAFSIAHDGTDFWSAGARNSRKLFRFDNTGKILQTIEMPENLLSVTWGASTLWVLTDTRKVIRMDRSGKRISDLILPEIMKVGGDGQGIAWDNETKTLWITSGGSVWNVQALTGYPSLPSVNAQKLTKAPVIDGKPNDLCWSGMPAGSSFRPLTGFGWPANLTRLRTVCDNRNLYVLIECLLPNGKRPKARKLPLDADPWNDESVEIMLSPYADSDTYYQVVVNAAGSVFDKKWGRGVVDGAKWNSNVIAKTSVTAKAWFLEIAIPLASFPVKTQSGSIWRFQAYRNDLTDKLESSAFAPTVTGKYHEPSQFGMLIFNQDKVYISDWRIGEPFYDGWPVEASIVNMSTRPVKANLSADIKDAMGKSARTSVTANINAGEAKLVVVSPAIHRDGLQTLNLQLRRAGNVNVLSSIQFSNTKFDPFGMASLRQIAGAAEKDIHTLPVTKRKAFQSTLGALKRDIAALENRLVNGRVKVADRTSTAIEVRDCNIITVTYMRYVLYSVYGYYSDCR